MYCEALIDKLRANAFEGRRKAVETQKVDEQKLFPLLSSAICLRSNVVLGFIGNTLKITENFLLVFMWEILTSVNITVFLQNGRF